MASTNPQSLNQIVDIKDDDKIMVTGTDNVTQTIPGSTLREFFCEVGSASGEAPAGAETKVVTLANSDTSKPWLSNYHKTSLPQQFKINIKFTAGNTYGNANTTYPKIQIKNADGTALGTFNVCDSRGHVAGTGCWNAGDIMTFKAVGNLLLIQNSDVRTANSNSIVYSDGRNVYPASQVYKKSETYTQTQINNELKNKSQIAKRSSVNTTATTYSRTINYSHTFSYYESLAFLILSKNGLCGIAWIRNTDNGLSSTVINLDTSLGSLTTSCTSNSLTVTVTTDSRYTYDALTIIPLGNSSLSSVS